ncbi:MAG: hypothetical protein ACE5FE_05140, partial [Acidiferrobacterales bacterium]
MAQPQSSQDWKQKYLASLEQLESQEREWSELESLLRLAVRSLSLAAEGIDPILDDQLAKIREVVGDNKQSGKLTSLIDDISRSVERLDLSRPSNKQLSPSATRILLDLLDQVRVPDSKSSDIKALRARLSEAREEEVFRALAIDVRAVLSSNGELAALDSEPRSHPDIARIQEVLIQLLDYLGLPEDLLPQANELEAKLGQELDTKQLTTILQTVADLVSQL